LKRTVNTLGRILFKEMVRDRLFLTFGLAAVALVLATLILNEMVVGQHIKATRDFGLTLLALFPLCIVLFLGIHLVARDLSRKTLYPVLAKGATRQAYIGAAFAATAAAMAIGLGVLAAIIELLARVEHDTMLPELGTAMLLTALEMLIVLAAGILFAVVTTSQLAMFLTLLLYVGGHSLEQAAQAVGRTGSALKPVIAVLYPLLPNLEFFNRRAALASRLPVAWGHLGLAALYALAYTALFMLLAMWACRRREL
jgi:Cu-processing system permease protein